MVLITSGEAFGPAITLATLPGTALTRKNVSKATPSKVTADQNNRVVSRRSMVRSSRFQPHILVAPQPHRMRDVSVQPGMTNDRVSCAGQWHPGRVLQD